METRNLWLIVGAEAALFFSLPTWLFVGEQAWPAGNLGAFILGVCISAAGAMLLSHIVPALCGDTIVKYPQTGNNLSKGLYLGLLLWFCIGAMISAGQIVDAAGKLLSIVFSLPGQDLAFVLRILVGLPLLVACFSRRWTLLLCTASGGIGFLLLAASLVLQREGLTMHHRQLSFEFQLNHLGVVCKGILLSAAPATVAGLHIGQQRVSRRTIWVSGLLGVWLPLSLSTLLVATAKMSGARLYWHPSILINLDFAFASLFRGSVTRPALILLIATTLFVPGAFCILAVQIFLKLSPENQPLFRLFFAGCCTLALSALWFLTREAIYFLPWCWTMLLGSLGLAASSTIRAIRNQGDVNTP